MTEILVPGDFTGSLWCFIHSQCPSSSVALHKFTHCLLSDVISMSFFQNWSIRVAVMTFCLQCAHPLPRQGLGQDHMDEGSRSQTFLRVNVERFQIPEFS